MKQTFAAHFFRAWSFRAGHWIGVGAAPPEDTTPVFRYRPYPSLPTVRPNAQPTLATVRLNAQPTSPTVRPR